MRLFLSLLLSLGIASSVEAVTVDWTTVGNPGNACDPRPANPGTNHEGCYGAVGYSYSIGTYEVTNTQYAEFLNAKARFDPFGLFDIGMQIDVNSGGIVRSGNSGSFTYAVKAGSAEKPVNYVSFYDALRFANWMHNGQGSADTETGSYTLLGPYSQFGEPSNASTVPRNAAATIALPSEDEWYKAAYYDAVSMSYFDYPARSSTSTACATPTSTSNRANCGGVSLVPTNRGSYTGSASPYGTFDQGGNLWEWNEKLGPGGTRGLRGGSFNSSGANLRAVVGGTSTIGGFNSDGMRLVMIPEPHTGLLVIAGLGGLAGFRRGRA